MNDDGLKLFIMSIMGFVFGFIAGGYYSYSVWTNAAIEVGHGEYDNKTGAFRWAHKE
jgi:hypothetical protein